MQETNYYMNVNGRLLDLSTPQVMGILNVTPDSFYAGSRMQTETQIATRVEQMLEEGADMIDIGAYSSRPGAADISVQEEMDRLRAGLRIVRRMHPDAIVSVDTFRAAVACMCVEEYGVAIVNDISGGEMDKDMFPTVARLGVPYVLMHMQGTPQNMQQQPHYDSLLGDIFRYFARKVQQLRDLGAKDIVLDPGFGFGKTLEHNYELLAHLEKHIRDCEWELDDDAESIVADQRYTYIGNVVARAVTRKQEKHALTLSDKIDRVVTDRILALPIFAGVMFLMYAIAMGDFPFSIGTMATDWANEVLFGQWLPDLLGSALTALQVSDWLYGLVMDGILAGVGSVLGFVPQILVLSFLLSILEDVGYMSRVAFIMDRILRKFGLSGKSIIPMLVATGCGVPGILASRTIEQDRDRRITVMTTGFIPCGAKMPIIGLFAGAVFGNSPLVATSAFFIGVGAVVVSGVILKKFKALAGRPAPFVMELPTYHLPSARNVLRSTGERGWDFVKRALTIVLLSSMVLWFLQSYGVVNGVFQAVEDNNVSLLADLGKAIAWVFYPLGWMGDMAWKATVATFTGLIAKEQVVMTFGTLYHYAGDLSESGNEIWTTMRAYSFMVFNLLCAPCFAAIGAIHREMHDGKWTAMTIGYMCAFAYAVSLIAYQIGGLFTGEASFGILTLAALAVLAGLVYLVARKNRYADQPVKIGV